MIVQEKILRVDNGNHDTYAMFVIENPSGFDPSPINEGILYSARFTNHDDFAIYLLS